MLYSRLQEKFIALAEDHDLLEEDVVIQTKILKTAEAIGNPDRQDYPLLKGKEFLMEASFRGARGQAYTDDPAEFSGHLKEIAHLPLTTTGERALFISCLNAVLRYLQPELGTVHCKDNEPEECAREITNFVRSCKPGFIGLVGLQPAILECLASEFGASNVACLDRDEAFRGQTKFGLPITWSDRESLEELFAKADLVLATGSTVVNGSLPEILELAERSAVPVYFFGTSIAGAAHLFGLNRLCFQAA
jgi:Putative heavy-metal chelation